MNRHVTTAMRSVLLIVLVLGAVPLVVAPQVFAQGDRYTNPYTGNTFNNPISSYLDTVLLHRRQQQQLMTQQFSNMLFNQMVLDMELRKIGKQRIAAGKASTRFVPSAKGSQVAALIPGDASADDKQKALAANRASLTDFHAAMKRFQLTPYDVADARALAFVMAFTAYKGTDPGPARLKKLRGEFKSDMMNDPMFQALPDEERQRRYETMVIPAMLAITARRQANQPGADAERHDVLVTVAERTGEGLLKSLWTKLVETIELTPTGFADRGEIIVRSGGGTTTFKRESDSPTVAAFARQPSAQTFGWDEVCYQNLLDRFDAEAKKMNLRTNDIADANVAAAAVLYSVFTNGKAALNTDQIGWLRKEMRKDILSSPDFQRLSGAKMQEVYETIALRAMHIRFQDEKLQAELAPMLEKSDDAFDNILRTYGKESTERALAANKNSAHALLQEIFSPRNFDDYRLTADGFQKR